MEAPRFSPRPFDEMLADLTLEQIMQACDREIEQTAGKELRLSCPFGCPGQTNSQKPISINRETKLGRCHAECCDLSFNGAYLIHGLLNGCHPDNRKLRGAEFLKVKDFVRDIDARGTEPASKPVPLEERKEPKRRRLATINVPLHEHGNATVRGLVAPPLTDKLIQETDDMTSFGAAYVRSRPYLTTAMLERWELGQMPSGGEDARGKSLGNCMVLPFRSVDGETLCYVGRDLKYEEKLAAWERSDRSKPRPSTVKTLPRNFNPALEEQKGHALSLTGWRNSDVLP